MMRIILVAAAAAVALASTTAGARAAQPYSSAAFAQSQKAGKSILLHVTAPWCSTCKAQHPIVAGIEKARPGLVVYDIDFDTSKETLRQLRVQSQSTLIMFKGAQEVGRSTGVTRPAAIEALVAKGL
jgi:thiol-disulfide isomerase/thioredoxin